MDSTFSTKRSFGALYADLPMFTFLRRMPVLVRERAVLVGVLLDWPALMLQCVLQVLIHEERTFIGRAACLTVLPTSSASPRGDLTGRSVVPACRRQIGSSG